MIRLLCIPIVSFARLFRSRSGLVVENLPLRQQPAVLKQQRHRPKLQPVDRIFWVLLRRVWSCWCEWQKIHRSRKSSWDVGTSASQPKNCLVIAVLSNEETDAEKDLPGTRARWRSMTGRQVLDTGSSRLAQILRMQAAHPRHLDDLPTIGRLYWPWDGTVVGKGSVRAYSMVIFEKGFENAPELLFMEHDHSIQALSANGTHQPLDVRILPRRSRRDELLLDAHAFDPLHEDQSVDRIAVPQQILGRSVVGERVDDLLRGPSRCG